MALLLKGRFALAAATMGIGAYADSLPDLIARNFNTAMMRMEPPVIDSKTNPSNSLEETLVRVSGGSLKRAPKGKALAVNCTAWIPEHLDTHVQSWASHQKRGCSFTYDALVPSYRGHLAWHKNYHEYAGDNRTLTNLPPLADYGRSDPKKRSSGGDTCFPVTFHHKTGLVTETLVSQAGLTGIKSFFRQQVVDDSVLEAELDIDEDFLYSPQDYAWQSATFELEAALHPYLAVGNLFPISLPGNMLAVLKAVEDARKSSPEKEWPRMQMLLRAVKLTPKNDTDFMSPACQRAGNDYKIVRRGPLREFETPWGNITLGDAYVPQDGPARLTANAAQSSATEGPPRLELNLVEGDGAQVLSSPWIYLEKAVGTECNWRPKSAVVMLELRLVESELMAARARRIRSRREGRSLTVGMLASRWRLGWRSENPAYAHSVWKNDRRRRALQLRATLPGLGEAKDSDWTLTSASNNYTVSDVTEATMLRHHATAVKPKLGLMTGLSTVTLGSTTDGATFSAKKSRSALCTLFRASSADDNPSAEAIARERQAISYRAFPTSPQLAEKFAEHSVPSMLRSGRGLRWDSASFAVDAVLDPVPWGNTTAFALPTELVRFLSQNAEHVSDAAELYLRGVVMEGVSPATSASSDDGECFTGKPLQGYTIHAGQRVFSDAEKSASPTWTETLTCPPPYPSSLLNYAMGSISPAPADSEMIDYEPYLDTAEDHQTAQRKVMFLPNTRQGLFKLRSQWLFLRAPERPVNGCQFNPSAVRLYLELTFKPERLSKADGTKLTPLAEETKESIASYTERCFPDRTGWEGEGELAALRMPKSLFASLPGLAMQPTSDSPGPPASQKEEARVLQISTDPRLACESWHMNFNNPRAALAWVKRQAKGCSQHLKIVVSRKNQLPWSKWARSAFLGQGLLPVLAAAATRDQIEDYFRSMAPTRGGDLKRARIFGQSYNRFPLNFSHALECGANQGCPRHQVEMDDGMEGLYGFLSPKLRQSDGDTESSDVEGVAESNKFLIAADTKRPWDKVTFTLSASGDRLAHLTYLGDRPVFPFRLHDSLLLALMMREPARGGVSMRDVEVVLKTVTIYSQEKSDLADDSTCLKHDHVSKFKVKQMEIEEVLDANRHWSLVAERPQKFLVGESPEDATASVADLVIQNKAKEVMNERAVVFSFPSGLPLTNRWLLLEKPANSGCYFTPRAIETEIELRRRDTSSDKVATTTPEPASTAEGFWVPKPPPFVGNSMYEHPRRRP